MKEGEHTDLSAGSLNDFLTSSNEENRLNALRSYHILDTGEEKDYDDLTAMAAAICEVPIAIISMVDEKRQWFKSHHGINVLETPIEHSICTHAIASAEPILIITDARKDQRFCNNPLVAGNFNLVFYAGVPLINAEGFALGSLCVVDRRSRELTENQLNALMVIAKQVVDKLELRRKIVQFQAARHELETSYSSLKQSEEERRDFIANISHDLRTPLSIAKGFTETLLLQEALSPKATEYLQLIENKILLVENLVKQLFDLSKMESVEFKPQKEPFVVAEILKEIIDTWQRPSEANNIRLECVGCENTSLIFADISMMERVFQNLMDNAIKFTQKDGGILVKLEEEDNSLILQFSNTGPSFSKEVINWISQTTKEKDLVKRPAKSGLGLILVKRILELHNYPFEITAGIVNLLSIRMVKHDPSKN